jgi:hypothetical protein
MHLQTPDRRRGYRRHASVLAVLRPLDRSGQTIDAHVFDLSAYGVGMSVREEIAIDTILYFQMVDGRQAGARIQVKSCRKRPDGMFDMGGQFC